MRGEVQFSFYSRYSVKRILEIKNNTWEISNISKVEEEFALKKLLAGGMRVDAKGSAYEILEKVK